MELCRLAGETLAPLDACISLPNGSLPDDTAKQKLVTAIEQLLTDEINGALGNIVPEIARRVSANGGLTKAATDNLGGPPEVAAGLAMRFYAGFLSAAKTLREYENQGAGLPPRLKSDADRAAEMAIVHDRASKDPVYADGVRFGPWGIRRPGRESETVCYGGISDELKDLYFKHDLEEHS
jgi:hypothetical protein